jgi:YesN/AraC family two-component response regulator
MIGDYFGLRPHYISGIFKQNIGENLKTYISRYRVDMSKKDLRNPRMNIQDIAVANGFIDSNAYIRVFKQYTGVTPGKYREMINVK